MTPRSPVPTGVLTLAGEALRRQREAEHACVELLEEEGFQLIHLPVLEYAEKEPGAGYRFVDSDGHLLALRTDFTPLAARVLAPNLESGPLPLAVCYAGEVVRPRPARLRQLPELYQLGFERYGESGRGGAALALTLRLLGAAGVPASACHVTASAAGMAEAMLARVLDGPADEGALELLRVRDLDALVERAAFRGRGAAALEEALLGGGADGWVEFFGLRGEVARLETVLAEARRAGASASLDVAPRLAGSYYRGIVFLVWGGGTRAVLATGGEYEVALRTGHVPAAGACVSLGIALEESSC